MRAYLRLDPNLADTKADYPDGAFRAFIECLTFAEQQPLRGRFRSVKLLRVFLDKRARWISYLVDRGDLIERSDGSLYVDGWDEWQEGDWKVHERVARIRNKKRPVPTPPTVTPDTPTTVTDNTPESVITPHSGKPEAVGGKHSSGGGAPLPNGGASTFMGYRPKPGDHVGQHENCSVCAPLRRKAS